ncbi:MAG: thiol reductase thioredoxin [Frankiales bacterium]|nr:thiol reductase thioredoxin [Frankiales bacterium]
MSVLVVLMAVAAVTIVLGLLHRWYDGRLRARTGAEDLRPLMPGSGERATLVQFSSAFCAPCRATRRVLASAAEQVPGVLHLEIDAEANLDLVRRLGILKTPTTLVLDARGHEVVRATGQPRMADVLAAIGQAVPS